MTSITWACLYEGASDAQYFDVFLPRLIEWIIIRDGIGRSDVVAVPAVRLGTRGRAPEDVASEACAVRGALAIIFIHADTGGRSLEAKLSARSTRYCDLMRAYCDWRPARCVTITPRHETEAWVLADPRAVTEALGYRGEHGEVGLPDDARQAERLGDPKAVLKEAVSRIAGPRRRNRDVSQLYPAIAQRQRFDVLRGADSFRVFEEKLRLCLADLGCLSARPFSGG